MKLWARGKVVILASLVLLISACGGGEGTQGAAAKDRPTVVVTTNILGDVVENLVGDDLNVVTIMPVGADPHDFQASAEQVAVIGDAAAMIVNGAAFEEGLLDVIESAEDDGVPVWEAISAVEMIEFGKGGHEDGHGEHEDGHGEHEDGHGEHEDGHDGVDPHFFTDPSRMAIAVDAIANFLIDTVEAVDSSALRSNADVYIDLLEALDTEVSEILTGLSDKQRVLVTNHEVFAYFADRYHIRIVGTVIPSGTTVGGASARTLAALAEIIDTEGVPAIFADTSSSDELAQTLADEVGEIKVVELYSESLGASDSKAATYLEMVRTNAERIAVALAG